MEQIVQTTPGAVDVENSLETSKPEIRIRIDRDKASDLGINVGLIAHDSARIGGWLRCHAISGGRRAIRRSRAPQKSDRTTLDDINNLTIKSTKRSPETRNC